MRTRACLALTGSLALAAAAVAGPLASTATAASGAGHDLLRASLAGSQPTDPTIFGVAPGAAPWDLERGSVRVRSDGETRLEVRGLLIPDRGVGPVRTVTATLACNGGVVDTSAPVPLSAEGDARLRETLALPERCLAPTVFLNPNGNPSFYIAISGMQR